jgi:hypothetical protein
MVVVNTNSGATGTSLYINGGLVATSTGGNDITAPGIFHVGCRYISAGRYTGEVDDVVFFTKNLTADEVGYLVAGPSSNYIQFANSNIQQQGPGTTSRIGKGFSRLANVVSGDVDYSSYDTRYDDPLYYVC